MDEAIDAAKEAILCHIKRIFTDDEGLPSSQSIESHRENELFADALAWAIVVVDISALAGTTKRVNITMPEGVLSRIEEVSNNRSRFLTEAAVEKLSRQARA